MGKDPGKSSCNWIVQQWLCASKVWELLSKGQGGMRHFRNEKGTGLRFSEGGERCFMFAVFAFKIPDNDTMKLSVNEAKLTGLWARNCATTTKVLILKFTFGPQKFPGFSKNRSLEPSELSKRFLGLLLETGKELANGWRLALDNIEWSQIGGLMNFTQRIVFIMERDWNVEWG